MKVLTNEERTVLTLCTGTKTNLGTKTMYIDGDSMVVITTCSNSRILVQSLVSGDLILQERYLDMLTMFQKLQGLK